jgi:hypothetical protein
MEISPVIGVRILPTVKAPSNEAVVSAEFDIQPAAWLGDDSYTESGKKAAGGDEPEEEELDYEETVARGAERTSEHSTGISYIA